MGLVQSVSMSLMLGVLFLAGCSFVGLTPGGEAVRVVDGSAASGCEEVGKTHVEVLDKAGILSRKQAKVHDELDTLARNAASDLGGNAVTPAGPVDSGKRTYRVLRCP